jgi:hypothetical protein
MSRADHRRASQVAYLQACAVDRPVEQPEAFDPDLSSWQSRCYGNRTGQHMRPIPAPDGVRCGSCWRLLRSSLPETESPLSG